MQRYCENCGTVVRNNDELVEFSVYRLYGFRQLNCGRLKFSEKICNECVKDLTYLYMGKNIEIKINKVKI